MKNILITGGAGFIGTNFVKFLISKNNYNIIVIDKLGYASDKNNIFELIKEKKIKFFKVDINNSNKIYSIIKSFKVDTIINFAAESHVDRSIKDPSPFIESNIMGVQSLITASLKAWKKNLKNKRFHHVSTDEVYGDLTKNQSAFKETSKYRPSSPYAASKASSDFFVLAAHRTYGLPITISNCSNNYGPFQFPEKLIPLTITNLLTGKMIPIYGTGDNVRDWIHVMDHCRAILKILLIGEIGETYNVGGEFEISNLKLVKKIISHFKNSLSNVEKNHIISTKYLFDKNKISNSVKFVPDRPGHDLRYAISNKKIKENLSFKNIIDFDNGLKSTINWYILNRDWWIKKI